MVFIANFPESVGLSVKKSENLSLLSDVMTKDQWYILFDSRCTSLPERISVHQARVRQDYDSRPPYESTVRIRKKLMRKITQKSYIKSSKQTAVAESYVLSSCRTYDCRAETDCRSVQYRLSRSPYKTDLRFISLTDVISSATSQHVTRMHSRRSAAANRFTPEPYSHASDIFVRMMRSHRIVTNC